MPTSNETKPFLTYHQQVELLKKRGLIITDDKRAEEILKRANYYRLSAYSLTLRLDDVFYPDVTIEDVVALYDFDVDFRKAILEFSGAAETAARAYLAYYHARIYGPLGYMNNQNFMNEKYHARFLMELQRSLDRSTDVFVIHHRENKNGIFPIWAAIEEMSFGTLSMFYKNMLDKDRTAIASEFYGLSRMYVETYMQCAVVARNIAAHGGRFYNRIHLNPSVKLPRKLSHLANDRPFAYVFAIFMLLPDEKKMDFVRALRRSFQKHPFAQPRYLGFPQNWEELLTTSTSSI